MSQKPVSEMDLLEILVRLMDLRAWAEKRKKDPWAFRQAIILIWSWTLLQLKRMELRRLLWRV